MSSHASGVAGEAQAIDFLQAHGLTVKSTRYRGANGEIDIIAMEGAMLCFVEVKHRPQGRLGEGARAVSKDKRMRMHRAARHYMQANNHRGKWRFDVLEITRAGVWYVRNGAQLI